MSLALILFATVKPSLCGDLFEFKTGLPLARNGAYGYFYGVGLE